MMMMMHESELLALRLRGWIGLHRGPDGWRGISSINFRVKRLADFVTLTRELQQRVWSSLGSGWDY